MEPEAAGECSQPAVSQYLVILNQSLADSEIHRLLKSQLCRVRVSAGTLPHTCIFPQSSVAFMVVSVGDIFTDWPPREGSHMNSILLDRLGKFSETHEKCYVSVCAPMLGSCEQKALSALQQQFLLQNMHFIPVHNSSECIECMLSIAKIASRSTSTLLRQRLKGVREQLLSESTTLNVVQQTGIDESSSLMLLDGCGSLAGIASASLVTLLECSVDRVVADKVHCFFHKS